MPDEMSFEIRRRIQTYKKQNPELTSADIAKKVGLSPATFHRIENLHRDRPNIEHVIKILQKLAPNDELVSFMRRNYPDLFRVIESGLHQEFKEMEEMGVDTLKMMSDSENGKVFRYIQSRNKRVSKAEIEKYFGLNGLKSSERLEELGYVRYEDGAYSVVGSLLTSRFSDLKRVCLKEIEESFNASGRELGRSQNVLGYSNYSLSLEGYRKLLREMKRFNKMIDSLLEDEIYQGDISVFRVNVADTLIENNFEFLESHQ